MRARGIAVAVLLVAGTVLAVCASLGVWAQRQALDTDEWVDTSARLLEDEPIRTALGLFLVDRLYNSSDVEQRLREVLPPRLDRLAAPAAAGLKQIAVRNAPRLLGSAAAINAWRDANHAAHETLTRIVDGDLEGTGVALDLRELLQQLADGTGLPPGAADKLPPELGELQVMGADDVDSARTAVDVFRAVAWVLVALALACFAAALALARDRRRTLLSVGLCLIVAGVATLALRQVAGNALVSALTDVPNAIVAATDAWKIATSLLVDAAQGLLLAGLLLVSAAWLAGPGRYAARLRRLVGPSLRDQPAFARAALAVLLLLLIWWGPVPWTGRVIPVLLLALGAFAWLEWIRRLVADELEAGGPGGETSVPPPAPA